MISGGKSEEERFGHWERACSIFWDCWTAFLAIPGIPTAFVGALPLAYMTTLRYGGRHFAWHSVLMTVLLSSALTLAIKARNKALSYEGDQQAFAYSLGVVPTLAVAWLLILGAAPKNALDLGSESHQGVVVVKPEADHILCPVLQPKVLMPLTRQP